MYHYISKYTFVKYYRIVFSFLYCSLFFLVPALMVPWSPVPAELSKGILFNWFVLILLGLTIGQLVFDRPTSSQLKKMFALKTLRILLALMIVLFVSSLLGADPLKSFTGNFARNDGLVSMAYFMVFALITTSQWIHLRKKSVIRWIFAGVFVNLALVFLQSFAVYILGWTDINDWGGSFGATFNQPVFLAGYLATTFPLVFWYITQKSKPASVLFACLIGIALVLTQTWGAILAFLITLVMLIPSHNQHKKTLQKVIYPGVLVSFLLVLLISYSSASIEADNRFRIGFSLLQAGVAKPILGWGWANVDYAFASTNWPFHREVDVYLDKAHSYLLEYFVTTGSIGLVLYLFLIRQLLIQKHSNQLSPSTDMQDTTFRLAVHTSMMSYLVFSQTNVTSIATEMLFWWILGLSLFQELKADKDLHDTK